MVASTDAWRETQEGIGAAHLDTAVESEVAAEQALDVGPSSLGNWAVEKQMPLCFDCASAARAERVVRKMPCAFSDREAIM